MYLFSPTKETERTRALSAYKLSANIWFYKHHPMRGEPSQSRAFLFPRATQQNFLNKWFFFLLFAIDCEFWCEVPVLERQQDTVQHIITLLTWDSEGQRSSVALFPPFLGLELITHIPFLNFICFPWEQEHQTSNSLRSLPSSSLFEITCKEITIPSWMSELSPSCLSFLVRKSTVSILPVSYQDL
jgi:hypothetical protein